MWVMAPIISKRHFPGVWPSEKSFTYVRYNLIDLFQKVFTNNQVLSKSLIDR